jgi:hypothetical protein
MEFMNKRFLMLFILLMAALVLPLVVSAQGQNRTFTVTEDEINSSFRVTNSARQRVSDMSVDLQADQVSLSYTYTTRGQRGQGTTSYSVNSVYVPTVTNGRITWTVSSVTVDGQPASEDLTRQINSSIQSSWRNYLRQQHGTGRVSSVTITDTDLTLVFN